MGDGDGRSHSQVAGQPAAPKSAEMRDWLEVVKGDKGQAFVGLASLCLRVGRAWCTAVS